MKTSIIALGTIITFIAGSMFMSSCGSGTQKETETQEQHDMEMTAKASCPMHPEETGKEGGKCSKCGMALVLNESAEHSHEN